VSGGDEGSSDSEIVLDVTVRSSVGIFKELRNFFLGTWSLEKAC
jgi:hypothetical protein